MTVHEQSELSEVVWIDPDRMSGAPCFSGTRVPVQLLLDHLNRGHGIDDFLEACPSVSRSQVEKFLGLAVKNLVHSVR